MSCIYLIYGSQPCLATPKIEVPESPIRLIQNDIDDVLTTIVSTPSTPIIGGYGQPELTTQDFQCSICRNFGHIVDYYHNSPLQSNTKCFYCGESGHNVSQCPHAGNSPTPVGTPVSKAPSALSTTSLAQPIPLSSPDTTEARTARTSLLKNIFAKSS